MSYTPVRKNREKESGEKKPLQNEKGRKVSRMPIESWPCKQKEKWRGKWGGKRLE